MIQTLIIPIFYENMRETFSEFDKNLINLEILILHNYFIDTTNDYTVNNAKARERISSHRWPTFFGLF